MLSPGMEIKLQKENKNSELKSFLVEYMVWSSARQFNNYSLTGQDALSLLLYGPIFSNGIWINP